jgi:hypothetical protein
MLLAMNVCICDDLEVIKFSAGWSQAEHAVLKGIIQLLESMNLSGINNAI